MKQKLLVAICVVLGLAMLGLPSTCIEPRADLWTGLIYVSSTAVGIVLMMFGPLIGQILMK